MSKPTISNFQDFENYRSICPFCSSELKLLCKNSIIQSGYVSNVTIREEGNKYILSYDSNSAFCTLIRGFIKEITIDKISNEISFVPQNDFVWDEKMIDSALSQNRVVIVKSCDCSFDYRISSNLIELTSTSITSCKPELFSELFCIDNQNSPLTFVKFITLFKLNITQMLCYNVHAKSPIALTSNTELPIVYFPFDDLDKLFKKVKVLLAFS